MTKSRPRASRDETVPHFAPDYDATSLILNPRAYETWLPLGSGLDPRIWSPDDFRRLALQFANQADRAFASGDQDAALDCVELADELLDSEEAARLAALLLMQCVISWEGRDYDFLRVLRATPVALLEKAATKSRAPQAWWEAIVALDTASAETILETVRDMADLRSIGRTATHYLSQGAKAEQVNG